MSFLVPRADITAFRRELTRPAIQGIEARLTRFRELLTGRVVFTTSFGLEDQILTDAIASMGLQVGILTLDTGRLFTETLEVWAETEARYGIRICAWKPDSDAVAALLWKQGPLGFRNSRADRLECCRVRKVVPLARALGGAAGWITGLRVDQSADRSDISLVDWDHQHSLVKFNPLFDQSRDDLLARARNRNIPLNALHSQGFPSIGCAVCTRAIAPGEPERAGRWWWEDSGARECGLHLGPDGRLARRSSGGVQRTENQA